MHLTTDIAALPHHDRLHGTVLAGLPPSEPTDRDVPADAPVRRLLRLEGAAAAAAGIAAFALTGASWWLFAALILLPDIALLGYLRGPRLGAALYNAAHTYTAPLALAALGLIAALPALLPVAAIWVAHIGFDRALGYGLKLREGFSHTHLGRIGG